MNRDELEGVISHEMSHIRNYDVRLILDRVHADRLRRPARQLARGGRAFFVRPRGKDGGQAVLLIVLAAARS